MRHTEIKVNIATVGDYVPDHILEALDDLLESDDMEFEDWKVLIRQWDAPGPPNILSKAATWYNPWEWYKLRRDA